MATQWIHKEAGAKRWVLLLLQQDTRVSRQGDPQNQDVQLLEMAAAGAGIKRGRRKGVGRAI